MPNQQASRNITKLSDKPELARLIERPDELAIRRFCRRCAAQSAERVQRLRDLGHFKNARRARAEHLQRREVHLAALFIAVRKRWPMTLCMTAAERETVRIRRLQSVFEKVGQVGKLARPARASLFLVPKRSGLGTRAITSFHWVDHARQIMLRSALTPFADLQDAQFMLAHDWSRRGPAAVRKALLRALGECDPDHVFLHFDVRDFYGSIAHDWLERHLGIDHSIVRHQVHTGQMILKPIGEMSIVHESHEANRERGQRGIPQGSALSCLVAELVMAAVIRSAAVFGELPVFIWSDNVGVLAPRHRTKEIVELARSAFADHGAGPFDLGMMSHHKVVEEFKFLGTWFCLRDGLVPEAFIPRTLANAWERSIGSRIMLASRDELTEIAKHVVQKRAEWGWWSGWEDLQSHVEQSLDAAWQCWHDVDGRSGVAVQPAQ